MAEQHIYGSARLGVQRYEEGQEGLRRRWSVSASDVQGGLSDTVVWYSGWYGDVIASGSVEAWGHGDGSRYGVSRTVGRRYYELSDHLGNVLATVVDRKSGHVSGSSPALYDMWHANVLGAQDYYPFGMLMSGRSVSAGGDYRFGYNGQQKDNEIAGVGNSIDYKARNYNTRIARFTSVDPLTAKFPWYAPYQFAGNTPIQAIDLDGKEEYYTRGGELIGKYGNSTEIRIVYDNMIERAKAITNAAATTTVGNRMNNDLYNNGSAGVFSSSDAAAADWGTRYHGRAIREKTEAFSFIFTVKINGKNVGSYTQPSWGGYAKSSQKWRPMGNSNWVSTIHSHANYDINYDSENFSWISKDDDIGTMKENMKSGYITTPSGMLKFYDVNAKGNDLNKTRVVSSEMPSDTSPTVPSNNGKGDADPKLINVENSTYDESSNIK